MTLLSPGVELKETSLQSTIVNNSTGRAAIVGKFQWGPAFQQTQVTSEVDLLEKFGGPDNHTADYFISAANFLQYGNDLRVVRAVNDKVAKNASPIAGNINYTINNGGSNYAIGDQVRLKYLNNIIEANGIVTKVSRDGAIEKIFIPTAKAVEYSKSIAQYPALSSSWTIDVISKGPGIAANITQSGFITDSGVLLTTSETALSKATASSVQTALEKFGMPTVIALYPGEVGDTIEVEVVSYETYRTLKAQLTVYPTGERKFSQARSVIPYGPQNENQYGIIVRKSGVVVESYVLSTKPGDKNIYGSNIFMDDFFANGSSNYIFATARNWPQGFSGIVKLNGGVSGNNAVTAGDLMQGWDIFADKESTFVNLMIAGACAGESVETASTVQKHVIAIADERRDSFVQISPPKELIVNVPLTKAIENISNWRQGLGQYDTNNLNISSTYMMIDGNYKYQYDKYNDVNRWVPLAADMAGLCARTDVVAHTWMSPAGYTRGQILNCIKLALEPRQAQRDVLYQLGINPVIAAMGGEGFILFGDKTGTSVPTPFDRINVRRLFNMIEKNIGNASKYRLFENNDNFTRNSFRMECTQDLAGIKALGGIYDFRVICDTTNNTPAVIDRNEFVATFYIKPARSINFITLNFVATSTGANFDEIIGKE